MTFLTELWLPILLSAVFVFIVSSVLHVFLPFHRNDVSKMPGEDAVLGAMRGAGVGPGAYMFPCPDNMKDCSTPEMKAKMEKGPIGWLTVMPAGGFNMGKNLALWFAYSVLIGFFVAYIGWHCFEDLVQPPYLAVFRITGATAFMGYGVGYLSDSIWKGASWKTTGKFVLDGFLYALVTAGTFGWLWPEAAMPGM